MRNCDSIILMQFNVKSPIKAFIPTYTQTDLEFLTESLSYVNTANQHKLKRHVNNKWLRNKNRDYWEKLLEELKGSIHFTLIFEEDGQKYIRPGSLPYLGIEFADPTKVSIQYTYPEPKKVPWAKPLPFNLHPYQEESVEKLINIKHGNVELCTSAGKSAILLKICRETGFHSTIIAPSKSIFNELLEKFKFHLGRDKIGAFGDGKKQLGKRFTICIGDSLCNVKPGTEEWDFFSKSQAILVDESHTFGAETLETICHGLFADVPYRLFFSGTQTRGDGAEKLLQSIIGKTVVTLTTQQAKDAGFIADHDYAIVELESSNPNYNSADVLDMKRVHFLGNRNIAAFTAKLANAEAILNGNQTLILVEELSQIQALVPLLKVPFAYAHSESNKKRLEVLGLDKVDNAESVEKFNKNEVKVLIGTSCISMGTNIFPQQNTINWVGGSSEIRTKQGAIGRSVRLYSHNPWKDKCNPKNKVKIWDFHVKDIYVLKNHLDSRLDYYRDSGSDIKFIALR